MRTYSSGSSLKRLIPNRRCAPPLCQVRLLLGSSPCCAKFGTENDGLNSEQGTYVTYRPNLSFWVWMMLHPCLISYRASPEPHGLPALEAPTHAEAHHLANLTWFQWLLCIAVICFDFTTLECNTAMEMSSLRLSFSARLYSGKGWGPRRVPGDEERPVEGQKVVYIDHHWCTLIHIHPFIIFRQIFEPESPWIKPVTLAFWTVEHLKIVETLRAGCQTYWYIQM